MQMLYSNVVQTINTWKSSNPLVTGIEGVKTQIQEPLAKFLKENYPEIEWNTESTIGCRSVGDRVDILGRKSTDDILVIIEIDNCRADQVAKKFVSRMALSASDNVIYITLCYSNHNSNEVPSAAETKKYAEYLRELTDVIAAGTGKKKYYKYIDL